MQVSKFSAAVCALALGCTASLHAADNPAQAAARAAIAAKLFEMGSAPATNKTDKSVTASASTGTASTVAKPVMVTPAIKDAPAAETSRKPALTAADAQAKAKQEAEAKAAEEKVVKDTAKKAEAQRAAEIAAAKKQAKASTTPAKKEVVTTSKAVTTKDNPAQLKAREALANSMFESSAGGKPSPATDKTASKSGIAVPVATAAPPLPISISKQQQLQTLLAKYKADQVSPEEYQKQRAAILAQP